MKTFFLKPKLALISIFTLICLSSNATVYPINVTFSGAQEAPANGSAGTGTFIGTYDDVTDSLIYTITFSGLTANVTAAHFHGYVPPGISGPVLIGPAGFPTGVMSGSFTDTLVLTSGQEDSLKMGLIYFNIHTSAFPGGEIRAQIFLQQSGFSVPVITCPADTSVNADPGLCSDTLDLTATVVSDTPTAVLHFRIGNMAITSPYGFPVGTTTVVATALNAAGYDTCTYNVTVNDIEPPVVTCPDDVVQDNDPGECGAIVTFPDAVVSDNCSVVTVTYSDTSGSFFPVGTTTVTVTATDGSGNSSTCTFDITVNDVEPPVIHDLEAIPPILWPPNHKLRNVAVNYTSTDNCPGPITCSLSVTSNQPVDSTGDGNSSPDWVLVNDHLVKLRAERAGNGGDRIYTIVVSCTDQYGNTGTDTATVLVPHNLSSSVRRALLFQYGIGHGNGHNRIDDPALIAESGKNMVILNEFDEENVTLVRAYPNPARNYFNIYIETVSISEKISVRLMDISGRVVETRNNISGSQLLRMGDKLRSGIYIAEIRQGEDVQTLKLMKME